nr:ribonuclease H-like domain-containing protein [Tanacetum cinerariifolium]
MEAGATTTMTAKLLILNPGDYDLWLMRIEHRKKQDKRNEMKVKGTLLMAHLNKDQLKFHSYQDAKLLIEAIEKMYGGNKESKKGEVIHQEDMNLKLLRSLPSKWKTHALIWRNKAKLETISLDDLYNNLKIYEPEISGSLDTNQNPQNIAFVSSKSINSTNEADTTTSGINTAAASVNTTVRPVNDVGSQSTVNHSRPKSQVNTIRVNDSTTRKRAVVSGKMRREVNAVKASKEYKEKRVIDSGYSRHMTGNKCYLTDFKGFDGGLVSFGDGIGRISSKGKIKTRKLDFDDVYFCKELRYNLFSMSQVCDKKNNVLFTDTECLVLSSKFKLLDESQVLLRVPRKDNIYSVHLKSVVPTGGLTCLFAKATLDESNL